MLRLVSNRNSGHMTYFLPACVESKFQNLDKSASALVAIPKSMTAVEYRKSYLPTPLLGVPYRILKKLIYVCVDQLLIHCFPKSRLGLDLESHP